LGDEKEKMQKMLVVVFDDETKAYQGSSAIKELDADGSISVHALAVVNKNPDGSLTTKEVDDDFPIRTLEGTAIGALIGVLGGPIGVALGASSGLLVGSVFDLDRADVSADYVDQVSKKLTPGKWAVVADITEEWETPVDTKMAGLGGTVFRANRVSVEDEKNAREQAAMKTEIAHLKEEQSKARQEDKAKLQKKIDALNAKLQAKQQQAKQRSDQRKLETEAKIHALQEKAKKSNSENKAKIEARIASLREWLNQPVGSPRQTQQVQSS
jgi:uncharacterized membrane protein